MKCPQQFHQRLIHARAAAEVLVVKVEYAPFLRSGSLPSLWE